MAVEKGIIKEIKGSMVQIEVEHGSGCSSCHVKSACMMGSNSKMRSIWIENNINADIGDSVAFNIEEKGVILSSLILYLFPVIFLITGVVISNIYSDSFKIEKDLASAFGGFIGFIFAFIIIKILSPVLKKNKIFTPILIETINDN